MRAEMRAEMRAKMAKKSCNCSSKRMFSRDDSAQEISDGKEYRVGTGLTGI